jgi:hypothetical protein
MIIWRNGKVECWRKLVKSAALRVLPVVMVCAHAAAERPQDFAPPYEAEIYVASCRGLSVEEVKQAMAPGWWEGATVQARQQMLEHHKRIALVTGQGGQTYWYVSKDENVCDKFPQGSTVKMVVERECCDTGAIGVCAYGGRWLREAGETSSEPIKAE